MTTAAEFVGALNRNDRDAAIKAARKLVSERVSLGRQWKSVSRFAVQVAEWPIAIEAIRRYIEFSPDDLDGKLHLADVLASAGRLAEAIELLAPLAKGVSNDARLHHLLGTAYIQAGDIAHGQQHLTAAARIWPSSGMTWLAIANSQNYAAAPLQLEALLGADEATRAGQPASRAAYCYAVGKAWDDIGEFDRAFDAFEGGAALMRCERGWDSVADEAAALSMITQTDEAWLSGASLPESAATGTIFVTGLPRSGTTLVEQILAGHSQVTGGGELALLEIATTAEGSVDAQALRKRFSRSGSPERAWGKIGPLYDHLVRQRGPCSDRFVDKSLNTSRFAALIRLSMPNARIVWLRRDPRDNAWSCYRTFFSNGLGWTFDLEKIARHFAVEDALCDHWCRLLEPQILIVPYELLVTDLTSWVTRISDHVGLSFEETMLTFHQLNRPVATASVSQVRRPLYQSSIGAASPYASRLDRFDEAYEEAKLAFDAALNVKS